MSQNISISHGEIEAQAKNLATIKNQLEQVLQAARTQVQTLVESGGFKSSAGSSFDATYEEWTTSTMKSVSLLEDMSTYLTKASGAFAEIDQSYTIK